MEGLDGIVNSEVAGRLCNSNANHSQPDTSVLHPTKQRHPREMSTTSRPSQATQAVWRDHCKDTDTFTDKLDEDLVKSLQAPSMAFLP